MSFSRILFAAAALTFAAGTAYADKACMMEGSGSVMGVAVNVKDCAQSASMSQAEMQRMCEGLANSAPGVTAKITYMNTCPKGAWGGCKNLFGQPVDAYYYHPDADRMQMAPKGCAQFGGTWLPAN